MKTKNPKDTYLLTAAHVVAKDMNISAEFVIATQSHRQIMSRCRSINRKKEDMMNSIRSEW